MRGTFFGCCASVTALALITAMIRRIERKFFIALSPQSAE
jgi:hypothetical protein